MNGETPRDKGYAWATWIPKLIAGEDRCWWKAWYKVHFKYEKQPDSACDACKKGGTGGPCLDTENCRASFFRDWTAKHDAMVERRAAQLKSQGWVVKVEGDGEFKVKGRNGDVIAGKPDIVALRGDDALVVECKSGKRRASDHWQALLYVWALPLSWLRGVPVKVRAEVQYAQPPVEEVRPLGSAEVNALTSALRKITGPDSPAAVPSKFECRSCDVASCSVRFRSEEDEGDASGYF